MIEAEGIKPVKIDYHVFKPVLFEFPTYEYFVTGEKSGRLCKDESVTGFI